MRKFDEKCQWWSHAPFNGCFRDSKRTHLINRSRKAPLPNSQRCWGRTPFYSSNFRTLIWHYSCRLLSLSALTMVI